MPRITAMEAYKLLPKTNCKECGEDSCMGFALKLVSRVTEMSRCPYLTGENMEKLAEALTPPVREVRFGNPPVALGGEEVMYRHELKFFNPCVIAVDVSDNMKSDEIDSRISFVRNYEAERMGEKLKLDAVAIRCASGNPAKFSDVVKDVSKKFQGPLILCSFDPEAIEEGIKQIRDRKPLLYAATEDNWIRMKELSEKYECPLVVHSDDISVLGTIASNVGHDNIVLDPGVIPVGSGLRETLDKFTMIRRSALKGVKEVGYPLMGAPAVVWSESKDDIVSAYYESAVAAMLMDRFASLLILHSTEPWSVLPLLTLRQNMYTDPRTEPEVEAKLYEIGKPGENSPVLVTTNFSLTYFTVEGDLKKSGIDCYLIVIDTKGFAVDTALATGDLSAQKVKEAIEKCKIAEKVKHRRLIMPLFASQIRGALEDETGWEVIIGPRDSSGIYKFLKEKWGKDG